MQLLTDISKAYDVSQGDVMHTLETIGVPKSKILVSGVRRTHYKVTPQVDKKLKLIYKFKKDLLPELEAEYGLLNKRTELPMMITKAAISYLLNKDISVTETAIMLRRSHGVIVHHKKNLINNQQHPLFEAIEQEVHSFIDKLWKSYA